MADLFWGGITSDSWVVSVAEKKNYILKYIVQMYFITTDHFEENKNNKIWAVNWETIINNYLQQNAMVKFSNLETKWD